MFHSVKRPASRAAALAATAALLGAAAPAAHAAAQADGDAAGSASAAVLRTQLDVSLLNGGVKVPLNLGLNEVASSGDVARSEKTLLSTTLEGVEHGQPFEVLRADVATAEARTDAEGSRADVAITRAKVHLPGLPLLSLIELETITASAVCAVGADPVAESNLGATARVLGEEVTLKTEGTTTVDAPGIGTVRLELSQHETTDTTAAAAALKLAVSVDPLDLGVATVDGELTLAEASCQGAGGSGDTGGTGGSGGSGGDEGASDGSDGASDGASDGSGGAEEEGPSTQTGADDEGVAGAPAAAEIEGDDEADLATTGGGSNTMLLVGGAIALLAAGGGTVLYIRRRAGVNAAS